MASLCFYLIPSNWMALALGKPLSSSFCCLCGSAEYGAWNYYLFLGWMDWICIWVLVLIQLQVVVRTASLQWLDQASLRLCLLISNAFFVASICRYWHIFSFLHHHRQPPGLMTGNRIGGKMSSRRWPLLRLAWPSSLSLPLLLAPLSLVTTYVPMILHDPTVGCL